MPTGILNGIETYCDVHDARKPSLICAPGGCEVTVEQWCAASAWTAWTAWMLCKPCLGVTITNNRSLFALDKANRPEPQECMSIKAVVKKLQV